MLGREKPFRADEIAGVALSSASAAASLLCNLAPGVVSGRALIAVRKAGYNIQWQPPLEWRQRFLDADTNAEDDCPNVLPNL